MPKATTKKAKTKAPKPSKAAAPSPSSQQPLPGMTPEPHQTIQAYAQREGFEICIETLKKLPYESAPEENAKETDSILLSPKD